MYPDGDYVIHVENNTATANPIPVSQYLGQTPKQVEDVWGVPTSLIVWVGIGIVLLVLLKSSIVIVKQQSVKVVELLGKFSKSMTAGFNLKIPFIERVVGTVDLRIMELKKEVDAKSKDNAFLRIPVRVQYRVIVEKVKEAFYTLDDAEKQMESYIANNVRSEAASMSMEEVFQNKDKFEIAVKDILSEKFSGFGYEIVSVLVDNPMPSEQVAASFNAVIASERLKEAAKNEAEAVRIKTVAIATAEAESLTLKATAYVGQREMMAKFFDKLSPDVAALISSIDYRDMVRDSSKNGGVVIVPSSEAGNNMGQILAALNVNK